MSVLGICRYFLSLHYTIQQSSWGTVFHVQVVLYCGMLAGPFIILWNSACSLIRVRFFMFNFSYTVVYLQVTFFHHTNNSTALLSAWTYHHGVCKTVTFKFLLNCGTCRWLPFIIKHNFATANSSLIWTHMHAHAWDIYM